MALDPDITIKPLHIRDDSMVADFGAGSGAFTLSASKIIHTGKIFAVDIQRGLLPLIVSNVGAIHKKNIEIIWGNIESVGGSKLKDNSIDIVFFANMLFQIKDKHIAIAEIKRVLKTGGQLLVVDWKDSYVGFGPKKDDVVNQESAKNLFEENGFIFSAEVPAGKHHYGIIFTLSNK